MTHSLLHFREPGLCDASIAHRCTDSVLQSDLSFPNIYLLKNKYGTEIMFHMEHLFRRFTGSERLQGYAFPIGNDTTYTETCLKLIEKHSKTLNIPLRYCLLTEEQVKLLRDLYGRKIKFEYDRGNADYLYKRENLANLPGTIYHKKRTHINNFLKKNPSAFFKKLDYKNREQALKVAEHWLAAQVDSPALQHEYRAIQKALFHMEQLQIQGGIVYVNDIPIAMALYSEINDKVTDIHYEKCIPEYRDAYAFINREIASQAKTEWINREEDLNIVGLRTAKLSYHPSHILQKYTATIYVD